MGFVLQVCLDSFVINIPLIRGVTAQILMGFYCFRLQFYFLTAYDLYYYYYYFAWICAGRPGIAIFKKWCYGENGGWFRLRSQLRDSVC